jgi:hypothetical protein
MAIAFNNPQTASLFETDFENDPFIEVGCECNGGKGYQGKLSDLPPLAAAELVIQKSNLVRAKAAPKQVKEKSNPPA